MPGPRSGEGERSGTMRLRKMIYALASLAALAMAIGAGWKPS
jgi:hypothetical protein